MTTIIGIETKQGVLLAADSLTSDIRLGKRYKHEAQPKISEVGQYLIAGSGNSFVCDLIQNSWKPIHPNAKEKKNLFKFLISKVAPTMRKLVEDAGYEAPENPDGPDYTFLIAINGELFEMWDDFSPLKTEHGFYGIGSGSSFALGALKAGANWERALEISCEMSFYSEPPFLVRTQKKK